MLLSTNQTTALRFIRERIVGQTDLRLLDLIGVAGKASRPHTTMVIGLKGRIQCAPFLHADGRKIIARMYDTKI